MKTVCEREEGKHKTFCIHLTAFFSVINYLESVDAKINQKILNFLFKGIYFSSIYSILHALLRHSVLENLYRGKFVYINLFFIYSLIRLSFWYREIYRRHFKPTHLTLMPSSLKRTLLVSIRKFTLL